MPLVRTYETPRAEVSLLSAQGSPTKAPYLVIVHHADGLHEGVADGRADEVEAAFLEVLRERVRFESGSRDLGQTLPVVDPGRAADELPDVGVERFELLLHLEKAAGVADRRMHLEAVSNDAGVVE